ncbi:GNAT family N-acetyltransferase [Demequina mangrovi]|uniref:Acetyltransferase (GNAT) family protein n=1 Tax=Demequina mangrovi TaxID=1043493 RepID=A0A1H7AKG4_9MICO|nr:GNAT family N-acetyltransferase [Demequina mangrovi]SEJ66131.1 Acetyltransferase (GNAT) family protein [Demequina mangrovi]
MTEPSAGPALEIVLDAGSVGADDAVAAMHRAFAEYTAKGQMSGALLETAESLREEIAAGERIALVRLDGEAVAVAKHHPASDGTLYFGRLGVVPEARGRGIAAALVRALRAGAHAEGLAGLSCLVRAEEDGNIAVYERLGMRVTGRGERVSRTGATLAVVEMRDA